MLSTKRLLYVISVVLVISTIFMLYNINEERASHISIERSADPVVSAMPDQNWEGTQQLTFVLTGESKREIYGALYQNVRRLLDDLKLPVEATDFVDFASLDTNTIVIFCSDAISDYERILKLEPDNEEARYNIGMLYLENQDFKSAETQFVDLLRYRPNSILYHQGMAFLNKATGNYSKAASNFSDVIKTSPTVTLLANRADCYLMLNKLSEAADDINSAIQIDPNDGYLYLLRAKLKKMRYEIEESQKDLQLAIDHGIDPALVKQSLK